MAEESLSPETCNLRPDDFASLTALEIQYTDERRQKEPYSDARLGVQSEIQKLQQAKAYRDPFTKIPKIADYGYPNSIQNIAIGEHHFQFNNFLQWKVKNYKTDYMLTEAPFTKLVMSFQFKIFEKYVELYDKSKAVETTERVESTTETTERSTTDDPQDTQAESSEKSITEDIEDIPADTSEVEDKLAEMNFLEESESEKEGSESSYIMGLRNPDLIIGEDVIVYEDRFSYAIRPDRMPVEQLHLCYTIRIRRDRKAQFTVATGIDTILTPTSRLMPSYVARDVVGRTTMLEHVSNYINVNRLNRDFQECLAKEHIIYFWSRGMIRYGHSYWIMNENNVIYLYHLSSSLGLEPMKYCQDVELMKSKASTLMYDSISFTYFHAVKTHYLAGVMGEGWTKIMEVAERCTRLLNRNDYPMEYSVINMVCSEYSLDYKIEIDEPELEDPMNPEVPRKVSKNRPAFVELQFMHCASLKHLYGALDAQVLLLKSRKLLPFRSEDACSDTPPETYDFEYFLQRLSPENVSQFNEEEYSSLFRAAAESDDLSIRIVVCALRKLFLDGVILGRMCQVWQGYSECVEYCELALYAWIAMCSVLKPDKVFPLPLRPLYMIGDVLYNLARNETERAAYFKFYKPTHKQNIFTLMSRLTSTKDTRTIQPFYGCDTSLQLLQKGLSYVARAILFSEVETEVPLLVRLCVIANYLAYNLLETCLGKIKPYPTLEETKNHLIMCEKIFDMVFRMSCKIRGSNSQVHITSHLVHAKWFHTRVAVSISERRCITDKVFDLHDKAFLVYEDALKAARKIKDYVDVGNELVRSEFLDALLAKIWKLKQYEDQEKRSFHSRIIPLFNMFLKKCQDGFDSYEPKYFQYRYGVGCASFAEYCFGLYRDSKHLLASYITEYWFLEARNRLKKSGQSCPVELLKTTCDLIAFYEAVAGDQKSSPNEYDAKAMEAMMECYETLKMLQQFEWHETGNKIKDEKMNNAYLALQLVQRRLLTVLVRRRSFATKIDLSTTDAHQLFRRCLNRTNVHLYVNLTAILEDVKQLLTAEGIL